MSMGETAEHVARRYGVTRERQEAFAVASQERAAAAQQDGRLAAEIAPVQAGAHVAERDGCLRAGHNRRGPGGAEARVRPDGTVTAGTSSPLTDGAIAYLVTSEGFARAEGMKIRARIRAIAVSGCGRRR